MSIENDDEILCLSETPPPPCYVSKLKTRVELLKLKKEECDLISSKVEELYQEFLLQSYDVFEFMDANADKVSFLKSIYVNPLLYSEKLGIGTRITI